jgi:MerR family transcriptional regulator, light-induced transcriptional regulator
MPNRKRHPIKVVARRTGITPELLRVWEKRYALVEPTRTETGRRVYSDADIDRLRLIHRATVSGRRVGEVSGLSNQALEALIEEDEQAVASGIPAGGRGRMSGEAPSEEGDSLPGGGSGAAGTSGAVELFADECLTAMRDLDSVRLEGVLARALVSLGSVAFIDDFVAPLLRTVGDLWEKGRIDPYHEHLLTGVIRQTVARHFDWQPAGRAARTAVVCTPVGQRHEVGAILAASALTAEGWRVIYLGADLPARDIAIAAQQASADIVALSIVHPENDPQLSSELTLLRARLRQGTKIIVGGAAAGSYSKLLRRVGAQVANDVKSLRFLSS